MKNITHFQLKMIIFTAIKVAIKMHLYIDMIRNDIVTKHIQKNRYGGYLMIIER